MVEEHELVFGEDLTGNVNFILASPFYNVQRGPNDAHVAYDKFCLNGMTYLAKVLGDVMKLRAHGNALYSTLQFFFWYMAIASEQKEVYDSTMEDIRENGSESEQGESVELHSQFEIENFVLHYIHVAGNYQQATAVRHTSHMSVVEMAASSLRSKASRGKVSCSVM